MTGLAITTDPGVEMQRPGLGDLAGRGAACGLTPDYAEVGQHLLSGIIHRVMHRSSACSVSKTTLPPVRRFPHVALARRTKVSSGTAQDRLTPRGPHQ